MKETISRLEPSLWTAPTPQHRGQKAAQDWEGREEKRSSSRGGSHSTARVRPSSGKCDLSGPSRYLEIRHQRCDLGRPKNVLVLKRDREVTRVTGSFLGKCHRAMSAWKSREWIQRAGRVRTGEGTRGNVANLQLGRESSRALAGCLSSTPEALGSVGRDTLWLLGLRTEGHTRMFYGQALPLTVTGLGKTLS